MLAASAAFRAAPSATVAADVVGAMLARWHYIALTAPIAIFFIELARLRRLLIVVAFSGLLLAATQSVVDLRIREIRFNSPIPISSLDATNPVRRRFGTLHGISMLLLLAQTLAAVIVVMTNEKRIAGEPAPERAKEQVTERATEQATEQVAAERDWSDDSPGD